MVVISGTVRVIRYLRRQRYIVDVVGVLCNLIATFLLVSSTYVVIFLTIRPWLGLTSTKGFALVVWSLLLVGLASWAYARAIFTNPGEVPLPPDGYEIIELKPQELALRFGEVVGYCARCRTYKPYMAHHCSTCRRCVRLMDHHCIWVNNCVGERTQKFFMLFLLYICLLAVTYLALFGVRFTICISQGTAACGARGDVLGLLLGAFVTFAALLFGIFVVIMGIDQVSTLLHDDTYIDRLKRQNPHLRAPADAAASFGPTIDGVVHEDDAADGNGWAVDVPPPAKPKSWLQKFERAFGPPHPSRWWWLLPVDPILPHHRWYETSYDHSD